MHDPDPPMPPSAQATVAGDEPVAASQARILARGDVIGRYVVLERLGAGGMGIVYAAYDPELDRRVAIKLIRSASDPSRAETATVRLLREAQSLAKLSHPNVVAVHDAGTYEGQVFVAMEYIDGRDLAQWLREDGRAWREIVDVFVAAGRGLAAAHDAGIVHRDFKPENVLVGHDGRVCVLDFGLAHGAVDERASIGLEISAQLGPSTLAGTHATASAIRDDGSVDDDFALRSTGPASQVSTKLTQAGAVVGTPAYMAPEQHLSRKTDARTDQFSFCVALYEALYRIRPFPGSTPHELMFSVLKGQVADPPRASSVPAWVRRVLMTGLAIDPDARWPDMKSLLAALSVEGRAQKRRFGAAAAGIVAIAGGLWAAWPSPEETADETCRGAERKLAGIWDDAVRVRIKDAFVATDRPYADDAFATTARYLDAYTDAWVAAHTDACEATAIRKEQSVEMLDRRMLCLDRRLREVEELTTLFRDADDKLVQRSVAAAGQLTPLQPCSDPEALAMGEAPLTGEQAEHAAEIDAMLAGTWQRLRVGRYEAALILARTALASARELDHPGLEAAALVLRGRAEEHVGRLADAERTLHEALWRADDAGDDVARARAWTTLVWVVGYRQERFEELDQLVEHARHALIRAGGDLSVEAELHNNVGTAAFARGQWTRAITEWDETLQLRERLNPDHPELAAALTNLAAAHARDGSFEKAEASLQRAQQLAEALYGPNHPRTANLLHSRALLAYERGRFDEAVTLLRRTVLVREASLPPDHIDRARALHDLGETLLRTGDARGALTQFQLAAEIKQGSLGEDHATIANSLAGVGRAHAALAEATQAAEALGLAEQMYARLGHDDANRAETRLALASALAETAPAEARLHAEAARAYYATSGQHPEPLARADALLSRLAR